MDSLSCALRQLGQRRPNPVARNPERSHTVSGDITPPLGRERLNGVSGEQPDAIERKGYSAPRRRIRASELPQLRARSMES